MKNSSVMISGNVIPTYFSIAIPWTIATMANSSAAIIDGIFVGNFIGSNALAAVNMVMPMFALMTGICIVVGTGGVVQYAKYIGENEAEKAAGIFTKTLIALAAIALPFSAFILLKTDFVLSVLHVNDELYDNAENYLTIIACFQSFSILGFGTAFFVRVDNNPRLASIAVTGGAILHILLDFLLIKGCGLGIRGAAFATGLSYCFMLLTASTHYLRRESRLRITTKPGAWKDMFHAVYNGSSELLNELSSGFIVLLINGVMIQHYGADGVAAFAVINYLLVFGIMASFGFSDSLSPLISTNSAAGKHGRSTAFLLTAMTTILIIGGGIFLCLTFFPQQLMLLFLPENRHAFGISVEFIRSFKWMFLLCGVNIVLTSYFTGRHRPLLSLITAGLRGMALPLIFIHTFTALWGIPGTAAAIPLSELITFCTGLVLILLLNRHQLKPGARASVLVHFPFVSKPK